MYSENYSEYEIIDAHAHIFPHKIADAATVNIGNFYDLPMHSSGSSERLVEHGNEVGVKMYLVCSTATSPHQVNAINKFIAKECEKYPSFFSAHSMSVATLDKEKGRQSMERYFSHMKKGLLATLHADSQVKEDAFCPAFNKEDFIDFVFSNLMTLLMQQANSCDFLLEAIRRIIYK